MVHTLLCACLGVLANRQPFAGARTGGFDSTAPAMRFDTFASQRAVSASSLERLDRYASNGLSLLTDTFVLFEYGLHPCVRHR